MEFKVSFKSKWADFDPNNHMRHTAYNDYAAECRVRFFHDQGFSLNAFNELQIGPVLFQEHTNFFREIRLGEDITVKLLLKGISAQGERFKFEHQILKENGELAAVIEVYGAWLDLKIRKLTQPPAEMVEAYLGLERSENFEEIKIKSKV